MRTKWILATVASAAVVAAASFGRAEAESAGPTTAQAFLAYCAKDPKGCDRRISTVEFAFLANSTLAGSGYCGPKAYSHAVGVKVLDRIAHASPDVLSGPTDDAIRSALAGLYPCKTGARSVADFLAACDAPVEKCSVDIDSVADALMLKSDPNYCPPDNLETADIMANWATIKQWLRQRRDAPDVTLAIADAWRARYPCSK